VSEDALIKERIIVFAHNLYLLFSKSRPKKEVLAIQQPIYFCYYSEPELGLSTLSTLLSPSLDPFVKIYPAHPLVNCMRHVNIFKGGFS